VPVQSIEIEPDPRALPSDVVRFLADADQRIDVFFEQGRHLKKMGFFPSDYEMGYRMLRALRGDGAPPRMCEWGSGFAVIAGLAAILGYDVHAVEIDPRLNVAARSLLSDHDLRIDLLEGSFIPDDYARTEKISDLDTVTVMTGGEVWRDSDLEIEDFDVIFAYPWPSEEEQYCDIFGRFADYGAVLVTYSMTEGMRSYRKVASRPPEGDRGGGIPVAYLPPT